MEVNNNSKDRDKRDVSPAGKRVSCLYTAVVKQYAKSVYVEERLVMKDNIFVLN